MTVDVNWPILISGGSKKKTALHENLEMIKKNTLESTKCCVKLTTFHKDKSFGTCTTFSMKMQYCSKEENFKDALFHIKILDVK